MSYISSKRIKGRETNKKVRRRVKKANKLNITSLTDVLTILLVFLIKNVSMEVQRVSVPANMKFPTTMSTEDLAKDADTVILKVYPDRILLGADNINVGSLQDLVSDEKTRKNILLFLTDQTSKIKANNPNAVPVLMIQADDSVLCNYISEIVNVSVASRFTNIYFCTLKGDIKEKILKL
ncbi:MAG TPA: biopolymer transporter ExbD [Candidatus Cloacimonadota bacterium]|nr:biopolymer transporter ExbD [Candidatus Cloacimonadota bacterium]HPT73182.1 biopolymer transporter ExbD [Candidatus Cloacimonadota bacterium]